MRNAARIIALLLVASMTPSAAFAWGFAGHRLIMRRAIELLPPELKPFYDRHRDELIVRAVDPDTWRNVFSEEDPNHFLDYGAKEYGALPFAELPRDRDAAIAKFGRATWRRNGTLPWRANDFFGDLKSAFENMKSGSAFAGENAILYSAALSHYMQDANQPFHATINFDGQLTGNNGIHGRFETGLVERFESRLTISPAAPTPILNARDAAFDALLASYQLVDRILQADREAVSGKDTYDDDYFEKLFARTRPILERRIADSITATAAVLMGAWEKAGRPTLTIEGVRPAEKVKKPQP
ncbi:MAG TPA: zinc dependent phospholipase C family protein [Vicinamibacterales bacterium]|nr:zinc dependent phospholipase C family protein [Vicinamibacterales bacterium]